MAILKTNKKIQKWQSSNVPRYRNDPIGYVEKSSTKSSTGSSGSSRSSGGGSYSSGGGYDVAAVMQAYLDQIQAQRQAAANAAYDRNVSAMNNAFDKRSELLKSNLDSTLQNLQTDYNASRDSINADATNAAREAYINNMMNQRNLAQNMAAQGLSGGASETTMAGLANNYGNARNEIATTQNENLGSLENLYNKNRNSANQEYNNQLAADALSRAQYMTQFENDRQNALAAAYESQMSQLMNLDPSYLLAMSGLTDSQSGYTATQQSNPLSRTSVSTTQGSAADLSGIRAPRYAIQRAQQMAEQGQSSDSIIQMLANNSVSSNSIAQILNQLGY